MRPLLLLRSPIGFAAGERPRASYPSVFLHPNFITVFLNNESLIRFVPSCCTAFRPVNLDQGVILMADRAWSRLVLPNCRTPNRCRARIRAIRTLHRAHIREREHLCRAMPLPMNNTLLCPERTHPELRDADRKKASFYNMAGLGGQTVPAIGRVSIRKCFRISDFQEVRALARTTRLY